MKRILVVDDDVNYARCISLFLAKQGYAVNVAGDGREAMALVSETWPDLILLDVAMPVMDGMSFAHVLRSIERWAHLPILVVTASSLDPLKEMLETGIVQNVMIKSRFSLRQLVAEIERLTADFVTGDESPRARIRREPACQAV